MGPHRAQRALSYQPTPGWWAAEHYNYFRDYDPSIGRYVESDPKGIDAGLNTYAYVDSSPLTWTDAYGLAKSPRGPGPWHPPAGVKTKCRPSDTCPKILGKIFILTKMIYSHVGWDDHMPFPRGGGRHDKDIEQLLSQLGECTALALKKCKSASCPKVTPPIRGFGFPLILWDVMNEMCKAGVAEACAGIGEPLPGTVY